MNVRQDHLPCADQGTSETNNGNESKVSLDNVSDAKSVTWKGKVLLAKPVLGLEHSYLADQPWCPYTGARQGLSAHILHHCHHREQSPPVGSRVWIC